MFEKSALSDSSSSISFSSDWTYSKSANISCLSSLTNLKLSFCVFSARDWKLLFFDVAASFASDVHQVHAVSFDAARVHVVASTVSAAFQEVPADYVSAGHVLISADRDRIC
ncbi:hypothetical protein Tco_0995377 [Tanacetum coccineum]